MRFLREIQRHHALDIDGAAGLRISHPLNAESLKRERPQHRLRGSRVNQGGAKKVRSENPARSRRCRSEKLPPFQP
jgi:hypothetical protein